MSSAWPPDLLQLTYAAAGGALGLKAGGVPGQTDGLPLGNRVLAKMEQDYDEEFTLDTQVRIKEIGEGTPKPQTSTSYLDPDPAASTDTQLLNLLLNEMKVNNRLLRRQERKAQGYERLAESIANALDRVISPTSAAIANPATTGAAPYTDPTLTSRLDALEQTVAQISATQSQLARGFNIT